MIIPFASFLLTSGILADIHNSSSVGMNDTGGKLTNGGGR
jgi:hypothetical protein